jgi:LPS O-antigen subunit length determinant protein (WzzB/FepE family)
MNQKRIIAQVIAAILLYTVISLILEKEYTQSVILRELGEGLIFGIIYGLFIWIREKWKNKRSE